MIRCTLILFLIISACALYAQTPHTFNKYSDQHGLTNGPIQGMVQDDDGYIWLACWGGVSKFDGITFTDYKKYFDGEAGKSLGKRFTDIYYDGFGYIIALSYDNSMYRFRGDSKTSFTTISNDIEKIFKLSGNDFIVTTSGQRVLRSSYSGDGKTFFLKTYLSFSKSNPVNSIASDHQGNLWIMAREGIYKNKQKLIDLNANCMMEIGDDVFFGCMDGDVFKYTKGKFIGLKSPLRSTVEIIQDVPGKTEILIGSAKECVFSYDYEADRFRKTGRLSYVNGHLISEKDVNGNVCIYSSMGGLEWYDSSRNKLVPFFNRSIQQGWNSENRITTILPDRQGDLWISSYWGGLEEVIFNEDNFNFKPFGTSGIISPESSVRAIFQMNDGDIAAATKDGKVHFLDGSMNEYKEIMLKDPAYAITQDGHGDIFLGTKGGGIMKITRPNGRNGLWKIGKFPQKSKGSVQDSEQIYAMLFDTSGKLWTGSFDIGLSYINTSNNDEITFNSNNGLGFPSSKKNRIRCLSLSHDGKLLIGTQLGMVVCDNPDANPARIRFTDVAITDNFDIQDILVTKAGYIYAATYGNGLVRMSFKGDKIEAYSYSAQNGLLSDFVLSATEDDDGNIWLATEGGLNKINTGTGSVTGFSFERLGYNMRFNEGESLYSKGKEIFLNTNAGIIYFNPKEISNSSYTPELMINSLLISGKETDIGAAMKGIKIRRNDILDLSFVAIDLTGEKNVMYYYRLDGRDKDWIRLGSNHTLSLSNIKAGKYSLRLRSTNGQGLLVKNEEIIPVTVTESFFSSIFSFGIIVLLLIIGIAFLSLKNKAISKTGKATEAEDPMLSGLKGDDRKFVSSLLEYIRANLDNGSLEVDTMADAMDMSRSALYKKSMALIHKTPTAILHEMRMDKAAKMIREGGYSISEIAYMSGFNDSHYFSKLFRKEFGMTPTEYKSEASSCQQADERHSPA